MTHTRVFKMIRINNALIKHDLHLYAKDGILSGTRLSIVDDFTYPWSRVEGCEGTIHKAFQASVAITHNIVCGTLLPINVLCTSMAIGVHMYSCNMHSQNAPDLDGQRNDFHEPFGDEISNSNYLFLHV